MRLIESKSHFWEVFLKIWKRNKQIIWNPPGVSRMFELLSWIWSGILNWIPLHRLCNMNIRYNCDVYLCNLNVPVEGVAWSTSAEVTPLSAVAAASATFPAFSRTSSRLDFHGHKFCRYEILLWCCTTATTQHHSNQNKQQTDCSQW